MTKRTNNAIKLLRQLSDGRWHTTWSLTLAAGTRFGGRLHELRKAHGIAVEKRQTSIDVFEYQWRDDADTKRRVLAAVERGEAPQPIEPKQIEMVLA